MKIVLLALLLVGCAAQPGAPVTVDTDYYMKPENIKCPTGQFAYCEGRNTADMVCQCVDRQQQRHILEQLQGVRW